MKKLILAALALLVCAGAVQAGPYIQPGTFITIGDGNGTTPGGEYNLSLAQGAAFDPFVSFCVQTNEYLSINGVFFVKSITGYAEAEPDGDGGVDPISTQTGWIYANYLAGATFDLAQPARADAVQMAIWYLENEPLSFAPTAQQIAARDAVLGLAATGVYNGGVGVLNLYYANYVGGVWVATNDKAQDLLAPVPEPSSILLFGTGLVGLATLARRRRA